MPFPQSAQNLAFALLFVALVVTSFLRARYFLFVAGMLLPLVHPRMAVGIGLDWYKLVGPIAIMLLFLGRKRGIGPGKTKATWFHMFVAYAVVLSAIWMVAEYNWLQRWRVAAALELGGGLAQTYLKMPVQLGSFLGQALCVYIVPAWASDDRDVRTAIYGYAAGCGLSLFAGLFSWAVTGAGTIARSADRGDLDIGEVGVNRLGGLSGEPKFLGACLAVLCAFALATLLFGRGADIKRARQGLFVFGAGLFMTFSTSSWVAFLAAAGVTFILAIRRLPAYKTVVIALLLGTAVAAASTVAFVTAAVEKRFSSRLQKRFLRKHKDAYVFYMYQDNPASAVFGYGLGGGDFAVIPYIEWLHLKYKRTPTPGVTAVRLWADLGTVGLLILGGIGLAWYRRLCRKGDPESGTFVLSGMAAALACGATGLSGYFFLAGAALARGELRQRHPRNMPLEPDPRPAQGLSGSTPPPLPAATRS